MEIDDQYTAYCFDEVCSFIIQKIKSGEDPQFKRQYKSFTDLYKDYP